MENQICKAKEIQFNIISALNKNELKKIILQLNNFDLAKSNSKRKGIVKKIRTSLDLMLKGGDYNPDSKSLTHKIYS